MRKEPSRNRITILLIGKLTEEKEFSLKSILKAFPFAQICIATNKYGRAELTQFMVSENIEEEVYFCYHDLQKTKSIEANLGIDELTDQYAFRSKEFKQLTSWKWLLLKDTFSQHKETNTILFSDLDVYWRDIQENIFNEKRENNKIVFCQDASDDKRGKWFCTGIMIWERQQTTFELLDNLYDHQIHSVNRDMQLDDESTFNEFIKQNSKFAKKTAMLNRQNYLTGFRALYATRTPNRTLISSSIAFHSNYILGVKSKKRALEMYENYTNGRAIKGHINFISVIFMAKTNRIVERLKKKLK